MRGESCGHVFLEVHDFTDTVCSVVTTLLTSRFGVSGRRDISTGLYARSFAILCALKSTLIETKVAPWSRPWRALCTIEKVLRPKEDEKNGQFTPHLIFGRRLCASHPLHFPLGFMFPPKYLCPHN
ncbi:hypothetical protein LDENG_00247650 [Lucifuga dentata]|nr:hypothetical protein LDENG_00247650 [Lucifuga dentata]